MEKLHLMSGSEHSFDSDETYEPRKMIGDRRKCFGPFVAICTGLFLLAVSVTTNITLFLMLSKSSSSGHDVKLHDGIGLSADDPSSWLGLKHDHPRLWRHNTHFSSPNVSDSDSNWVNMDIDYATVALSAAEVAELGLPEAGEAPWAPGYFMYGVSPVHALHCLKFLHRSNMEYRHDLPQTYPTPHLLHCLDVIRDTVTCTFDDMPLGLPLPMEGPNTQYRQCKDWSKLERWAKDHAICVTRVKTEHHDGTEGYPFPESGRYCPPESPLLPSMREFFDQPADWIPPRAPPSMPLPPGVEWKGYHHETDAIDGF